MNIVRVCNFNKLQTYVRMVQSLSWALLLQQIIWKTTAECLHSPSNHCQKQNTANRQVHPSSILPKGFFPCREHGGSRVPSAQPQAKIVICSLPLPPMVSWTSFSPHFAKIFFEDTAVQNPLSSQFHNRCCNSSSSISENPISQTTY